MKYIKKWVPRPRVAMLGGSSVHFDRAFLNREMPEITAYLTYQYVYHSPFARRTSLNLSPRQLGM